MNLEIIAFAAPIVFLAYAVFGMTGFGSALIAVPLLVHFMPLTIVVPLVVLLDLVGTAIVGGSNWRSASMAEVRRILPWMLLGIVLGVTVLLSLPPRWPLIVLGLFVLYFSARNLRASAGQEQSPIATGWAMPFGIAGGIFSALFGTGGPVYTIYVARRLPQLSEFRATIALVILCSGLIRLVAFGLSGVYFQPSMVQLALALLLPALLGVWLGSRLRSRIAQQQLRRLIYALLALAGIGVLYKGLTL